MFMRSIITFSVIMCTPSFSPFCSCNCARLYSRRTLVRAIAAGFWRLEPMDSREVCQDVELGGQLLDIHRVVRCLDASCCQALSILHSSPDDVLTRIQLLVVRPNILRDQTFGCFKHVAHSGYMDTFNPWECLLYCT